MHQQIAKHYDFSPRLLGFLCSSPIKTTKSIPSVKSKNSSITSSIFWKQTKERERKSESPTSEKNGDDSNLESSGMDEESNIGLNELSISHEPDLSKTLNQYALASDLWHYSTMDWGRRCELFSLLFRQRLDVMLTRPFRCLHGI